MDSAAWNVQFLSSIADNNLVRVDAITHIERRRGSNRVVVAVTADTFSTAVWQSEIIGTEDATDQVALATANTHAAHIMATIAELVSGAPDAIAKLT